MLLIMALQNLIKRPGEQDSKQASVNLCSFHLKIEDVG